MCAPSRAPICKGLSENLMNVIQVMQMFLCSFLSYWRHALHSETLFDGHKFS